MRLLFLFLLFPFLFMCVSIRLTGWGAKAQKTIWGKQDIKGRLEKKYREEKCFGFAFPWIATNTLILKGGKQPLLKRKKILLYVENSMIKCGFMHSLYGTHGVEFLWRKHNCQKVFTVSSLNHLPSLKLPLHKLWVSLLSYIAKLYNPCDQLPRYIFLPFRKLRGK